MAYIMVDIESDGPCPGLYSMVSFGAVVVEPGLNRTYYSGVMRPLPDADCVPQALAVSGVSRDEQLAGRRPEDIMPAFAEWLRKQAGKGNRLMFISDNNGFDWQFINYYFHKFTNGNPFGFSSTNLGSLYKGMVKSCFKNFKHLRKTKHTHHPVDDAKGNAEALLHMHERMGLGIKL